MVIHECHCAYIVGTCVVRTLKVSLCMKINPQVNHRIKQQLHQPVYYLNNILLFFTFIFHTALLGKEKKSNVSFGTTADRPLFPASLPVNRIGNGMALDTAPHRGPGSYDNAEVTWHNNFKIINITFKKNLISL